MGSEPLNSTFLPGVLLKRFKFHPKTIYWRDQYMPWGLTIPLW
jgi:hypothetical protein